MRCILVLTYLVFSIHLHASKADSSKSNLVNYKLKINLLDQSFLSLPTIKFSNEFLIERNEFPSSFSIDLGYNFYSVDEQVKSSGYYLGAAYNFYLSHRFNRGHGLSCGIFYLKTNINDYLKVSYDLTGLGTYYKYEKMKYHKERYGLSVEYFAQFRLSHHVFIETRGGPVFMYMHTITPDRVTQYSYPNGLNFGKEILTPSIMFNLKIGYLFY